jgi:hypothetical protein
MTAVTIERLRSRDYQLHAFCPVCDRWKLLDLDEMLALWDGLAEVPSEVQCDDCGQFGLLRVRTRVAPSAADVEHTDATDRALTG